MKKTNQNDKIIFLEFLKNLIKETIYPYAFQAPGCIKICGTVDLIEIAINMATEIKEEDQQIQKEMQLKLIKISEAICDNIAYQFSEYFKENSHGDYFFFNFLCYSSDVFYKLLSF